MKTEKARYIVLTDINRGIEQDDIQSLVRLLLYSNDIEIEGLIACTSCFLKHGAKKKNEQIIHQIIDAYLRVKPNLDVHANGYPSADYLHSVTCCGIPKYGKAFGNGFGEEKYCNNAGVRKIISCAFKNDSRPLYIGIWGGANTLAQAIWTAEKECSKADFRRFLSKLRIYAISDQDFAGKWIRDHYGEQLFYIVTPSHGSRKGSRDYFKAAWPGMSADRNNHGSEDGVHNGGFCGADYSLVSNSFIKKRIRSKKPYGKCYPYSRFIMEGDSPSYLALIPNGLNCPEHPDYGGWGGRYEKYIPEVAFADEKYPIWTNAFDCVKGNDGKFHKSPQATIWRWREAVQNDFLSRLEWTVCSSYETANHPPHIETKKTIFYAERNERIRLDVSVGCQDGAQCTYKWLVYHEAGENSQGVALNEYGLYADLITSDTDSFEIHIIFEVQSIINDLPITKYKRFIIYSEDKENRT